MHPATGHPPLLLPPNPGAASFPVVSPPPPTLLSRCRSTSGDRHVTHLHPAQGHHGAERRPVRAHARATRRGRSAGQPYRRRPGPDHPDRTRARHHPVERQARHRLVELQSGRRRDRPLHPECQRGRPQRDRRRRLAHQWQPFRRCPPLPRQPRGPHLRPSCQCPGGLAHRHHSQHRSGGFGDGALHLQPGGAARCRDHQPGQHHRGAGRARRLRGAGRHQCGRDPGAAGPGGARFGQQLLPRSLWRPPRQSGGRQRGT